MKIVEGILEIKELSDDYPKLYLFSLDSPYRTLHYLKISIELVFPANKLFGGLVLDLLSMHMVKL
jgi:hypothetical protein